MAHFDTGSTIARGSAPATPPARSMRWALTVDERISGQLHNSSSRTTGAISGTCCCAASEAGGRLPGRARIRSGAAAGGLARSHVCPRPGRGQGRTGRCRRDGTPTRPAPCVRRRQPKQPPRPQVPTTRPVYRRPAVAEPGPHQAYRSSGIPALCHGLLYRVSAISVICSLNNVTAGSSFVERRRLASARTGGGVKCAVGGDAFAPEDDER